MSQRYREDFANIIRDIKFEIERCEGYGYLEELKYHKEELKKVNKLKNSKDENEQLEYIKSIGRITIDDFMEYIVNG